MIPTIYVRHITIFRALSQHVRESRRSSVEILPRHGKVSSKTIVSLGDQGTFALARRKTCRALIAVSSNATADFVITNCELMSQLTGSSVASAPKIPHSRFAAVLSSELLE